MRIGKKRDRLKGGMVEGGEGTAVSSGAEEKLDQRERMVELVRPAPSDRMRVSVDITRSAHRKLKVHAAQHEITLNEVVEQLADRHCDN